MTREIGSSRPKGASLNCMLKFNVEEELVFQNDTICDPTKRHESF
jgi:hypothetical protein